MNQSTPLFVGTSPNPSEGQEKVKEQAPTGKDLISPPHYIIKDAINPALNGNMYFQYPNAWDNGKIYRLIQAWLEPAKFDNLPPDGKMWWMSMATLSFTIKTAPEGWYQRDEKGMMILAVAAIGNGDEMEVVKAYRDGFIPWADKFRRELRLQRDLGQSNAETHSNQKGIS